MAGICYVSSGLIHQWLGATHAAAFTDLAISIPLGAAVYFALCKAMGIPGAERMMQMAASRLRRSV